MQRSFGFGPYRVSLIIGRVFELIVSRANAWEVWTGWGCLPLDIDQGNHELPGEHVSARYAGRAYLVVSQYEGAAKIAA